MTLTTPSALDALNAGVTAVIEAIEQELRLPETYLNRGTNNYYQVLINASLVEANVETATQMYLNAGWPKVTYGAIADPPSWRVRLYLTED